MKNPRKALELIDKIIADFQSFVVYTHEEYYKQDSDRAYAATGALRDFKVFVEKRIEKERVNERSATD